MINIENIDKNSDLISVIMTSYNYAHYLSEGINSIISQTYKNWELIIIDDASSDNSVEIIDEFVQKYPDKIKFIKNEKNLGIKKTNEIAFQYVKGEYVAFLESDDVWNVKNLEKKIHIAKKYPEAVLIYSNIELIGNIKENKRYYDYLNYCNYAGNICKNKPKNFFRIAFFRNPIVTFSNIFIKKEILNDLILNKEYEIWSDWQLVIQSSIIGKFLYLDDKLVKWRIHQSSTNNKFVSENNQNSEAGRFRAVILKIIKDKISRKKYDENIKYLYDIFSLKFKFRQILHEFGFVFYSPLTVFRELLRRLK